MESRVWVEDHVGGYESDGLVILQEGLRGARLLSPSLELSEIEEMVPIGTAGPWTLGARMLSYVLPSRAGVDLAPKFYPGLSSFGRAPTAEANRPGMLLIAIALGSPSHAPGSAGDIEHVKVVLRVGFVRHNHKLWTTRDSN